MSLKKRLPFTSGLFTRMITEGYVYVDKTRFLYELIMSDGQYYMFNRPRRFGKSTVVTTLKELFLGNKELFNELWISGTDYAWPVHPVIHLDMSKLDSGSPEELRESLTRTLRRIAMDNNVSFDVASSPGNQLVDVVTALAKQQKVVILIDEYDCPTVSHLDKPEIAKANHAILKSFYTKLKALEEHLRFVFLTGVSKMPKDSSYSGLNNVQDISLDPRVAALAGYTEEDLHTYFLPHVEDLAKKRGVATQQIFDEMRQWYNGYYFSGDTSISVYNPFSILNYLHNQVCQNYWILSGRPSFLLECLKREKYTLEELDKVCKEPVVLSPSGGERLSLSLLLYQTGYVTIASADENRRFYYLGYPNKEVKEAMEGSVLAYLAGVDFNEAEPFIRTLKNAFIEGDVAGFVGAIQTFFAQVPYKLHIEAEKFYHALVFALSKGLGLVVQCEVVTSLGQIDMIVQNRDTVFVIEFKLNVPAEKALAQIKKRRYYEQFMHPSRRVFLLGVAFNFSDKKLAVSYVSEELQNV
ncbi:MAG: AAA family ATPase [bacterium]